jgi:hypothetical protein
MAACLRKSLSFEGEQQKIEHTGSRKKFSAYIYMLWPDQKLMYDFYDRMNSTNTIAIYSLNNYISCQEKSGKVCVIMETKGRSNSRPL